MDENLLCYCKNGRLYQDCHKALDEAADEDKYAIGQKIYASDWSKTSKNHRVDGVYKWVASNIQRYDSKRILDVGCGAGDGLISLIETFGIDTRIVSFDENTHCIDEAERRLKENGITVTVVKRGTVALTGNGFKRYFWNIFKDSNVSQVTLIESDICNDPFFEKSVKQMEPFDLVTVWFIGTHTMIGHNVDLRKSWVKSNQDYRFYVQNKTYDVAELVLRPGGVLQVVDRMPGPFNEELEGNLIQSHKEQASTTSLVVLDVTSALYDGTRSQIGLVRNECPADQRSASKQISDDDMVACCIVSQKPVNPDQG